jgi:hypothetical protein
MSKRLADLFASPWGIFTQFNSRHNKNELFNNKNRPPQNHIAETATSNQSQQLL